MDQQRTVVVGAGIAGATTAFHLAIRGERSLVLEKELLPGTHSSGRNAAILRTLVGDPVLQRLASRSHAFYLSPPEGFSPTEVLNRVGVILAAPAEAAAILERWAGDGSDTGAGWIEPSELYRRVPILSRLVERAILRSDEGVLDVHAILEGFLRGAKERGAEIRGGCSVDRLVLRGNRVAGIRAGEDFIPASRVVLAGGGWVKTLAEDAGLAAPIVPYRRHLMVTTPVQEVRPDWPVVWIAGDEFYFRPESGGLLISVCDSTAVPSDLGETVDASVLDILAAKVSRWIPSLAGAGVARMWAGMRTFAPDHRFVIGPDSRVDGLFWVAGLGGHGMTCAPAVGALAADWILDGGSSHASAEALKPSRLWGAAA
jgi:D-arginine dehydrogenase